MTWIYGQSTGSLTHDGTLVGVGYSGYGDGKLNPDMQDIADEGPIPRGFWRIGTPYDSESHGSEVMSLTPLAVTETFGRSGFLIHGDAVDPARRGDVSLGCIVMSRPIRDQIVAGREADSLLEVTV